MPITDYAASEFEPRHLSPEEVSDPTQVYQNLFDYAHLPQWREQLRELFNTLVCDNFHHQTRREKEAMIYFFGMLQKLVEVSHLLHRKAKES